MKKRIFRYVFLGLYLILLSFSLKGGLQDELQKKLAIYQRENPTCNLYVHTDRNIYLPGDTIWFKAYMLSAHEGKIFYVRLVDLHKNIVVKKQFPVYDIRSNGEIALPDTLSEGKYLLYAYTDLMINFSPKDVFVQAISITANTPDRVEMEAFATNPDHIRRGEKVEIGVRVHDKAAPVKNVRGEYRLWVSGKMIKSGQLTTNRTGETFVHFTYPRIADSQSVRFEARLNGDKKYAELSLNLRHEGSVVNVSAYPEGGHLLEGIYSRVVLRTLDDNQNPVSAIIVLRAGKRLTDSTQTDKQGIGEITFIPQKGILYTIAVKENGVTRTIPLPVKIEAEGYGLKNPEGKNQDTAIIYNRGKPEMALLVLRSFDKLLWSRDVRIPQGDSIRVLLPLSDFPKGIMSLALFDSSGRPQAERLFMNKQATPDDYRVQVTTGKKAYGKHDKVNIGLSITDQQGRPVATNLSVAVVEKSTLDTASYRTILHSFYYHHLSVPNAFTYDKRDLDALLITQNWEAYDWQHIVTYHPRGTLQLLTDAGEITGMVTAKRRKQLTPETLLIWSKSGIETVALHNNGSFSIPPQQLVAYSREEKRLLLGKEFPDNYEINISSHSDTFDHRIESGNQLSFSQPFSTVAKYTPPDVKIFNSIIQLKEVVISADGSSLSDDRRHGDYVCRYNVLNCPNHPFGGRLPVVGVVYLYHQQLVVYNGQGNRLLPAPPGSRSGVPPPPPSSLPLPEISLPQEFYLPDYSSAPFAEPDARTTVFWTPNLNTDSSGKAAFSFYTSDIKSDYTIVIQGIEIHTLRPVYSTYNLKL